MVPHPTTAHAVTELRRQDLLAFAASQRLAASAVSPTPAIVYSIRRRLDVANALGRVLSRFAPQPRFRVWKLAA
jgi:hypothetical protein